MYMYMYLYMYIFMAELKEGLEKRSSTGSIQALSC